ncbi:MAG: DUF1499 domain-containing protein [Halioglobus sp.]|nr:DUF1499 domain-containing protein [Halioglobus sp.]
MLFLTIVCLVGCTSAPEAPLKSDALPDCGVLPNCVISSPAAGGKSVAPLRASARQWQRLKQWIAAQPDWRITSESDDYLQAVVISPLMRFRDDVQLRFDEGAESIQVRSSSRLGISDMGVNRKRVEMLRLRLADTTP